MNFSDLNGINNIEGSLSFINIIYLNSIESKANNINIVRDNTEQALHSLCAFKNDLQSKILDIWICFWSQQTFHNTPCVYKLIAC